MSRSLFASLFQRPRTRRPAARAQLRLEALETRQLLSCNTISGFVFVDVNNDGIFDADEAPIAGSTVKLKNAAGVVIGATTTDDSGYYEFTADSTVKTTPATKTVTLEFPEAKTNSITTLAMPQFDPDLGEVQQVDIRISGHITSSIKVENVDPSSSTITTTVAGTLTITGPNIEQEVATSQEEQTITLGAYDGAIDFTGRSGADLGSRTATGEAELQLLDPSEWEPFVGEGTVSFSSLALANSTAAGGGNLAAMINSTGAAMVSVVYSYIPSNCLKPGNYTIVQTKQPAGYFDGPEYIDGDLVGGSVGGDQISVTLVDGDLLNNNFVEVAPASLSGYVYHDASNDGVKDDGELPLRGIAVTLRGVDDTGHDVLLTKNTNLQGFYAFTNLRPGTYRVSAAQAAGYLDGIDTPGTSGGEVEESDQISEVILSPGTEATDYNFGEIKAASIGGYVYLDANNDGVKGPREIGIPGVALTLLGVDDQGNDVELAATTNEAGAYSFANLRPGSYSIVEEQPAGYLDGQDTPGSLDGTAGEDDLSDIEIPAGAAGTNYNFGELQALSLSGCVFVDKNNNGVQSANEPGIADVAITLTGTDDLGNEINETVFTGPNGQYAFTGLRPGTYTLTQAQPDGYLDGKVVVGTAGGFEGENEISEIVLDLGFSGRNYCFAELPLASLSGLVYHDKNNNGKKSANEPGIADVFILLTGEDDLGNFVELSTTTDANGFYSFTGLRPGTYVITETQPEDWINGKITTGTAGGKKRRDEFYDIRLSTGTEGLDYNFGERKKPNTPSVIPPGGPSKIDFLASSQKKRKK